MNWNGSDQKIKRHRLMNEENPSQRIVDACNNIRLNDLYALLDTLNHKPSIAMKKRNPISCLL